MKKEAKRILSVVLSIMMLVTAMTVGAFAADDFDGYTAITNATELKAIENNLAGKYYLANDITMPTSWESIGWLADGDTAFTGIFDGNGKTISGLTMNYDSGATYVGLFAINGGTVKNVTIDAASVRGGTGVGALVAVNKGTIENCSVKNSEIIGVVKNYSTTFRVGGLVGQNGTGATISNCSVADTYVTGNNMVGGFVGSNMGTIAKCTAANVSVNSKRKIADIYKNGAANLVNYGQFVWSYVGGFAGNNQGTISNVYVLGNIAVYGFEYVGGLVGYNSGTVAKSWMGAPIYDIPYYNPYNYGSYSFYAEHVHTDIGYTEKDVGTASDVYVIDGTLPHAVHTFGDWTVLTPATCTASGLRVHECTQCGFAVEEVIPAKGHTEGEWTVVTDATCTAKGLKEKRCTVCDELLESEEIPAKGHTEGEWTVVTDATCTAKGLKEKRCTVCNELLESEEIPANGHTEGEWTVVTDATCTAKGLKEKRCTVCDELLESEEIPAKGHTYSEWTVVTDSTCTDNGYKELRCTDCGEVIDSKIIPAKGHTDADGDGICDDCSTNLKPDSGKSESLLGLIINMIISIFKSIFASCGDIC